MMQSPSEDQDSSHTSLLIVKCIACCCSAIPEFHLAIDKSTSALKTENSIAISYTWGEFDRRDVRVGHPAEQPWNTLFLNLGQEWDVPELLQRLAELSHKHKSIWIDQLCIPKNDSAIKLNLAKIPTIYSTLDVVAIFPGSPPCPCFGDWVKQEKENKSRGIDSRFDPDTAVDGVITKCFNAVGFCSWTNRIWTRQELTYSSSIRVIWNLKAPKRCLKSFDKWSLPSDAIQDMNPFAYQLFTGIQSQSSHKWAASNALMVAAREFYLQGKAAINHYLSTEDPEMAFAEFLFGKRLQRYTERTHPKAHFRAFLYGLTDLSTSVRTATHPQDLVLSVWIDCPGYIIPSGYREFKPSELLEDAIRQLEKNHSIALATTCPVGLFDESELSAAWRPSTLRPWNDYAKARDMYGPFRVLSDILPLRDGVIPLRLITDPPRSITHRARDLKTICETWTTPEALYYTRRAVDNWTIDLRMKVFEHVDDRSFDLKLESFNVRKHLTKDRPADFDTPGLQRYMRDKYADALAGVFGEVLTDRIDTKGVGLQTMINRWKGLPDLDHHDLIYRIVTGVLGLDYRLCLSNGLRLVIATEDPVCIGLIKLRQDGRNEAIGSDISVLRGVATDSTWAIADTLTMWTSAERPGDKWKRFLYEAKKLEEEAAVIPRYRVVGVWVPCEEVLEHEIGATPDIDGTDALLV